MAERVLTDEEAKALGLPTGDEPIVPVKTVEGGLTRISSENSEPQVSGAKALALGVGHGATLGLLEPVGAALDAASPRHWVPATLQQLEEKYKFDPQYRHNEPLAVSKAHEAYLAQESREPTSSFGERYAAERDKTNAELKAARDQHPGYYLGGSMLGSTMLPVPGMEKLEALKGVSGLAARVGTGTALGAGMGGLEESTRAEPDYVRGIGYGAAGGLWGGLLGEALRGITSFFSGRAAKATEDALAKGAADKAEAITIARGAVGGNTQTAHRMLSNVEELLEHGTPEEQQMLREWLKEPSQAELRRKILLNSFERAKGGQAAIATAEDALQAAAKVDPAEFANESVLGTAKRAVLPRVATLATRTIPAAVGSSMGGPIGSVAGGLVGGAMGNPGTILTNLLKDPNVRRHAFNAAEGFASVPSVLASRSSPALGIVAERAGPRPGPDWARVAQVVSTDPSRLGDYGPVLAKEALTNGEESAKSLHELMLAEDPAYVEMVSRAVRPGAAVKDYFSGAAP